MTFPFPLSYLEWRNEDRSGGEIGVGGGGGVVLFSSPQIFQSFFELFILFPGVTQKSDSSDGEEHEHEF